MSTENILTVIPTECASLYSLLVFTSHYVQSHTYGQCFLTVICSCDREC